MLTHLDEVLGNGQATGQRHRDPALGPFHPLRDLDFPSAREQADGTDLPQVHADRIGILRGLVMARLELRCARAERSARKRGVSACALGLDDVDAGGRERGHQLLRLIGAEVRRHRLADLVGEQVSLFPPDDQQLPNFLVPFLD